MSASIDKGTASLPELVVMGGSAGALERVTQILSALPPNFGPPIVIVLHLPKRNPAGLPDVLSHAAARVVLEAQDKDPLTASRIFVAPPDYHLLVEPGGLLALSVDDPVNFSRPSIDVFFESAADVIGAGVLGILLSGANADGARGLAAIAAAGGETIVQDPSEASTPIMPQAGKRSTPSAEVLGIEQIIARLRSIPTASEMPSS